MAEIRELLNDIISSGNKENVVTPINNQNFVFDPEDRREKYAFGIIRDMTKAMMKDEPLSNEEMLDDSILDHIHKDYKGTCFGYLNDAKKRLHSPLFESLLESIEDAVFMEAEDFKAKGYVADNHKINMDIIKDNPDYQTFRDKLSKETSNMVVNDVAKEVLKTKDTPVFNIDEKIKAVSNDPNEAEFESGPEAEGQDNIDVEDTGDGNITEQDQELQTAPVEDIENPLSESMIVRMTQNIVSESYVQGKPMTTDQGMEKAVCEFCVQQLCFLVKDHTKKPFDKYL